MAAALEHDRIAENLEMAGNRWQTCQLNVHCEKRDSSLPLGIKKKAAKYLNAWDLYTASVMIF